MIKLIKKIHNLLLCEKYVNAIFKNAKSYDITNGKVWFSADESLLETLFPEKFQEARENAENEYRREKNV